MSWVCLGCSNNNDASVSVCDVCGAARPTRVIYPESTESKVVFSTFAVIAETTKSNIRAISRVAENTWKLAKKAGSGIVTLSKKALDGIKSLKGKIPPPKTERVSSEKIKREKKVKAPTVISPFAKPWPEHDIKFDISTIKSKGYVKSERAELNSVKGYYFYKADGTRRFLRSEMLVVIKLANNK